MEQVMKRISPAHVYHLAGRRIIYYSKICCKLIKIDNYTCSMRDFMIVQNKICKMTEVTHVWYICTYVINYYLIRCKLIL